MFVVFTLRSYGVSPVLMVFTSLHFCTLLTLPEETKKIRGTFFDLFWKRQEMEKSFVCSFLC